MSLVTRVTFLPFRTESTSYHETDQLKTSNSSSHALLLEDWGTKVRVLCRQPSAVTDPKILGTW